MGVPSKMGVNGKLELAAAPPKPVSVCQHGGATQVVRTARRTFLSGENVPNTAPIVPTEAQAVPAVQSEGGALASRVGGGAPPQGPAAFKPLPFRPSGLKAGPCET